MSWFPVVCRYFVIHVHQTAEFCMQISSWENTNWMANDQNNGEGEKPLLLYRQMAAAHWVQYWKITKWSFFPSFADSLQTAETGCQNIWEYVLVHNAFKKRLMSSLLGFKVMAMRKSEKIAKFEVNIFLKFF